MPALNLSVVELVPSPTVKEPVPIMVAICASGPVTVPWPLLVPLGPTTTVAAAD